MLFRRVRRGRHFSRDARCGARAGAVIFVAEARRARAARFRQASAGMPPRHAAGHRRFGGAAPMTPRDNMSLRGVGRLSFADFGGEHFVTL